MSLIIPLILIKSIFTTYNTGSEIKNKHLWISTAIENTIYIISGILLIIFDYVPFNEFLIFISLILITNLILQATYIFIIKNY
jgi:hypothetical protein